MVEGVLFYWFAWFFCIIVMFFMKKGKQRTFLMFWLLFSIIGSNQFVQLSGHHMSLTFIIISIGSFLLFSQLDRKTYHFLVSFNIMIGYVSFLLFVHNSPIWLFAPRLVLISVLMTALIVFLSKRLSAQLVTALIGLCSGELLYYLILLNYSMAQPIGASAFLDLLLLILFQIFIIDQYQTVKKKVSYSVISYRQAHK